MDRKCHFCGGTSSIHWIEEEGAWICSKCWEIIAYVVKKFMQYRMKDDQG